MAVKPALPDRICWRLQGMRYDGTGFGQERITLLSCLALASINLPKRQDDLPGFAPALLFKASIHNFQRSGSEKDNLARAGGALFAHA